MTKPNNEPGILYIVATPIGHLADMTFRAVETLKYVDFIAAEDTCHSQKLLQHYNIHAPTLSLHEHNERIKYKQILKMLREGQSVALISDAGTPLISDPGYRLVHEAVKLHIPVVPIPGANAVVTALCVSGLPSDRFTFIGFLPAKSTGRIKLLKSFVTEAGTLVFYESPHRLLASLYDMRDVFGGTREIVLARELTKRFETIRSGHLDVMIDWLLENPEQQKGEFVLLIAGQKQEIVLTDEDDRLLRLLLSELPVKQAAHLAAKITGKKKNLLYEKALKIVKNNG